MDIFINRHLWIAIFVAALSMLNNAAFAQTKPQSPHVHGTGHLNIVVDKDKILLELIAPASDLTGFEHRAETDEQQRSVQTARKKLKDPLKLFDFAAEAECKPVFSEVLYETGGDDDKKFTENVEFGHAEFHAVYELKCRDFDALKSLPVNYFRLFPMAKKLIVRTVGKLVQDRLEVTKDDPIITF